VDAGGFEFRFASATRVGCYRTLIEPDAMRTLANLHWVMWLRSIGRVQEINVRSSLDAGRVDKVLRGRRYKLKFKRGRDSSQAGLPPRIPGFAGYGGNP
jgi:hypothetical protein